MADVAVSHMLLFVASLIVAAGVAGAFSTEVGRLSNDIDDVGLDLSNKLHTDITIISDAGSPVYDVDGNETVRVYVKNTGTRSIRAESIFLDVLLDGVYQPSENVSVTVLEATNWTPGRVVQLEVDAPGLASGTHRISIVVEGDREVMEFTV